MNSPTEPSSPSPSTPSSGTPPPEEYVVNTVAIPGYTVASHGGANSSGGPPKRRLPKEAFGTSGSSRDAKTRRRGESGRGGTTTWEGMREGTSGGKKEKDELIDTALVDYLRKEIGDPFQEPQANLKG